MNKKNELPPCWNEILGDQFQQDYMKNLKQFLTEELAKGKILYPHGSEIFEAYRRTLLNDVKVVIIGQDPYHGPGQAHGLCFSVKKGVRTPPSLNNIYKELLADIGKEVPDHGNLEHWADQGVFLLNTVLTVEQASAAAHRNRGWEQFTDETIKRLSEQRKNLVFLLWGSPAQKKASLITGDHLILKSPHPSPLSAHRGFFGCKHFSQTNQYLSQHQMKPIDW
ncbi:MAG: uracil-DNA glycosylase [Bacteriovoracaceae bacterium]